MSELECIYKFVRKNRYLFGYHGDANSPLSAVNLPPHAVIKRNIYVRNLYIFRFFAILFVPFSSTEYCACMSNENANPSEVILPIATVNAFPLLTNAGGCLLRQWLTINGAIVESPSYIYHQCIWKNLVLPIEVFICIKNSLAQVFCIDRLIPCHWSRRAENHLHSPNAECAAKRAGLEN